MTTTEADVVATTIDWENVSGSLILFKIASHGYSIGDSSLEDNLLFVASLCFNNTITLSRPKKYLKYPKTFRNSDLVFLFN